MKNKSIVIYFVYSLIGFMMMASFFILHKLTRNTQGIIYNLPFVLFAIGFSVFIQNITNISNIRAMKREPLLAKQKENDEKDERNIAIKDRAKAKAFDFMLLTFGALIMLLFLILINQTIVHLFVIVYVLGVVSYFYFMNKYNKEM